jgi:hypothetical protein
MFTWELKRSGNDLVCGNDRVTQGSHDVVITVLCYVLRRVHYTVVCLCSCTQLQRRHGRHTRWPILHPRPPITLRAPKH